MAEMVEQITKNRKLLNANFSGIEMFNEYITALNKKNKREFTS